MHPKSKDITLLLLYMTCWPEESEKAPGGKLFRTWKNYSFELLNQLEREGMIQQYAHSIVLTHKGNAKARCLGHRYLPPESHNPDK